MVIDYKIFKSLVSNSDLIKRNVSKNNQFITVKYFNNEYRLFVKAFIDVDNKLGSFTIY